MGETQFLLFIETFEKCLEMGETQFLLFIGTFEKCLEKGEITFLPFLDTFHNLTEPSAAGARRGVRSVPVRSVPSRRSH